jgi:hypothetical protein
MIAKVLIAMVLQKYEVSLVSFRMDTHPAFVRPANVVIQLNNRQ